MAETSYDSEGVLQALIAQHPEVLADETAGQGPLLLVRREGGVSDQEDAGGRWSLDHLYVDSQGVPTLRGSQTLPAIAGRRSYGLESPRRERSAHRSAQELIGEKASSRRRPSSVSR
jgi:hypothetical protein